MRSAIAGLIRRGSPNSFILRGMHVKEVKKPNPGEDSAFWKDLATTYSRGSYTTTTIGKAEFDGRVRDGIGSGHSFMVTKKSGF